MSVLSFLKVEGAGNDFLLLDSRHGGGRGGKRTAGPLFAGLSGRRLIRSLCDRHRGIGADGVLELSAAELPAAARVRYWNADGGAAAFCGNGARCVALLLLEEAGRPGEVAFLFGRTMVTARPARAGRISLLLPRPALRRPPGGDPPATLLPAGSGAGRPQGGPKQSRPRRHDPGPEADPSRGLWIDSGVPHWIQPVRSIGSVDLAALGPRLRAWPGFGPKGSNVDLVEASSAEILVRTFERGVEGETLACGSGLLAAGFWAVSCLNRPLPLRLRSRGGDLFHLRLDRRGRGLWLEGPARLVFRGTLALPARVR